MSTQAQYNLDFAKYILYYCGVGNSDVTVYQTDLSDVCTVSYDGSDNVVISNWLIGGYAAPSTVTILTYTLAAVNTFYDNFYYYPSLIAQNQPESFTTAEIALLRTDASMTGYVVFDDTVNTFKRWNGSAWVTDAQIYLALSGAAAMTGALNMGTNAISGVTTLTQTTPMASSIWSSDAVSIGFTINTPRMIDITNFTDVLDPAATFTVSTSTGQITYTGAVTRYFRVSVDFSIVSKSGAGYIITNYLSKNGSTTINGKRTVLTFVNLGELTTSPYSLNDVVQLAQNDTIQLGANLNTTDNITYSNVSYAVSAL